MNASAHGALFVTISLMNSSKSIPGVRPKYRYFPLMVHIHATSGLVDTCVVVILATSTLFALDVGDVRIPILVSLFVSMIPFIALVPTVGLLVQKIHVPRIVLSIYINCFRLIGLILMAMAASNESNMRIVIFPLSFLMLTLSKSYCVVRTSALPQVTTVESFPFFSSRLAMTTGIVSIVSGGILYAISSVFSEPVTLYFSSVIVFILIVLSFVSYTRLTRKAMVSATKEMDSAEGLNGIEQEPQQLSNRNLISLIKSLFTFMASTRLVVGIIAIGVALEYRSSMFMIALCLSVASLSAFIMNASAVIATKTRYASLIVYIGGIVLVICALVLIGSGSSWKYLLFCSVLGAFGAYSRVIYESRIASVLPDDINTVIISRGEVIMQLAWIIGVGLAVVSFNRIFLGIVTLLAISLGTFAYRSSVQLENKTHERF